ncbi:hypothetical protein MIDIC_470037 [Alphaproteobacteria bacterium]
MSLCVIGLIPLPLGEQFSTIFLFYVIQGSHSIYELKYHIIWCTKY